MNVPNYVDVPVVDPKTGMFTGEWKAIMQQLLNQLIVNAGPNGLVAPSATASEITTIAGLTQYNPIPGGSTTSYVTQFGTLLYDSTNEELVVCLSNAGVPTFYTVVTI